MTCRRAGAGEISSALRMVLSSGPAGASDEQVVDFMRYALARGIDTKRVYVSDRGGQLTSACLPIPSAGRTLLLLTSAIDRRPDSDVLVEQVLDEALADGVRHVQVLLEPEESEAIEFFSSHRFERLAELLYLQTSVKRTARRPALPEGFALLTYSEERHALFARTIAATYEGSLDCPRLAGRRDIEDVIAGHRATGEFDPARWFVLSEREQGIGVLLCAPAPPTDSMELVYLGLTPAARGKDLGDLLLRQALYVTHETGLPRLTIAVDSANVPALKLYYRHGLRRVHSKVAMMREMRKTEARRQKSEGESGASTVLPQGR